MLLTVDTSALIAVIVDEPQREMIVDLARGADLIAPASVRWEVGNVLIQRCDGQAFVVRPQVRDASPLDVGKVNVRLTRDDILGAIYESRARLAEPRTAYRVRRRRPASKPAKRRA